MSLNIYIYTYGYYYPDGRKTSVFFKKIFIGHIKDFLTCIFIPFSHFSLWNICQPNRKVPNNDSFGSLFSIQLDSDGYIHIFFPFYWTVVCDNVIRFFKGDLIDHHFTPKRKVNFEWVKDVNVKKSILLNIFVNLGQKIIS